MQLPTTTHNHPQPPKKPPTNTRNHPLPPKKPPTNIHNPPPPLPAKKKHPQPSTTTQKLLKKAKTCHKQ